MEDPIRRHLEAALLDTSYYFQRGQLFIATVGLFVIIGGVVREMYWLSLIGLLGFGGMVALMTYSYWRTKNHPLRRIILDEPERITSIVYRLGTSSSGAFPTHWLRFTDDAELSLSLRFEQSVLHGLAPFLAWRFVNANIQIPGFDPERDAAQF